MVSINRKPTARTSVDPDRQGHLLSMSAGAAILAGIGGIDSHYSSIGASCLIGEKLRELRPCRVRNRFSETMIMHHPVDFEVLDGNRSKVIDDFPAVLVSEIVPAVPDALVDTSNPLALALSLPGALLGFGELSLLAGQVFLVSSEELGSRDNLGSREGGKGGEANVNAHGFGGSWESSSLHLAGDADEPLAGGASLDRTGLGSAFQGSMEDNPYLANLGELQDIAFKLPAKFRLRKGEGVISVVAPEAGIAGIFPILDTAEEGFEGQVDADSHVLEHLGVDFGQRGTLHFEQKKGFLLPIEGETFLSLFPGYFSLLQEMIVEPAALIQGVLHQIGLLFGRLEPISESFTHVPNYSASHTKKQVCCAIHPPLKSGGLLARFL